MEMVPPPFEFGRVKDAFRQKFKRPMSDQESFVLFGRAPRYEDACTQVDTWHRLEVAAKQRADLLSPLLRSFGASSGRGWAGLSARVTLPRWDAFDVTCWVVLLSAYRLYQASGYTRIFDVLAHEIVANPCSDLDAVLPRWTLRDTAHSIALRERAPLTEEESAILDLCALAPL